MSRQGKKILFDLYFGIPNIINILVSVEVFAAGDGINYPRQGNTVTVHYTV